MECVNRGSTVMALKFQTKFDLQMEQSTGRTNQIFKGQVHEELFMGVLYQPEHVQAYTQYLFFYGKIYAKEEVVKGIVFHGIPNYSGIFIAKKIGVKDSMTNVNFKIMWQDHWFDEFQVQDKFNIMFPR